MAFEACDVEVCAALNLEFRILFYSLWSRGRRSLGGGEGRLTLGGCLGLWTQFAWLDWICGRYLIVDQWDSL